MQGHRFYLLAGLIISIVIIFTAITLATERTSFFGRAQTPGSQVSISRENSYVFASPISANSDGKSIIRITVFILNSQGLGVAGQTVELTSTGAVTVGNTQPVTDTFGRATFDVTSTTSGTSTIRAAVGGVTLPQTVSISFR